MRRPASPTRSTPARAFAQLVAIAAHDVERFAATERIDVEYLGRMSADAVPVLVRLPAPLRDRALRRQRTRLARGHDGLAGANLARSRARRALAALAPQ